MGKPWQPGCIWACLTGAYSAHPLPCIWALTGAYPVVPSLCISAYSKWGHTCHIPCIAPEHALTLSVWACTFSPGHAPNFRATPC
eukprot:1150342-Pelagomonas_calceolata.AAC.9